MLSGESPAGRCDADRKDGSVAPVVNGVLNIRSCRDWLAFLLPLTETNQG